MHVHDDRRAAARVPGASTRAANELFGFELHVGVEREHERLARHRAARRSSSSPNGIARPNSSASTRHRYRACRAVSRRRSTRGRRGRFRRCRRSRARSTRAGPRWRSRTPVSSALSPMPSRLSAATRSRDRMRNLALEPAERRALAQGRLDARRASSLGSARACAANAGTRPYRSRSARRTRFREGSERTSTLPSRSRIEPRFAKTSTLALCCENAQLGEGRASAGSARRRDGRSATPSPGASRE